MSMITYYLKADEDTVQKIQEGNSGEIIFNEENEKNLLDIDKTWHAIHFTLTGEVWETSDDNILSQLILGGEPVNDEDMGYGPARLLSKEIVSKISDALKEWDETVFLKNFKIKDMIANDVYPLMDDEDEKQFFDYTWGYFNALKEFVKEAAEENKNIIVFMG